jgi:hypothetical protein
MSRRNWCRLVAWIFLTLNLSLAAYNTVRAITLFEERRGLAVACGVAALFSIGAAIFTFWKFRASGALADQIEVLKKETAKTEAETAHLTLHLSAIHAFNILRSQESVEESD